MAYKIDKPETNTPALDRWAYRAVDQIEFALNDIDKRLRDINVVSETTINNAYLIKQINGAISDISDIKEDISDIGDQLESLDERVTALEGANNG
jgi:hypothetical protein